MMQRIVELDSQILSSIQKCLRSTKYQFIDSIVPLTTAPALERGGLMHDLIEIYYGIKGNSKGFCINPDSKTWLDLINHKLCSPDYRSLEGLRGINNRNELIKFVKLAGELRAQTLELGLDTCAETIDQFEQYVHYYKNDTWSPLLVEESGAKTLYEDEEIKIIYIVKIDRVMENGNTRAPFDTKTGQRNNQISSMSNQFIGYCWFLDCTTLIVDRIGFQKTLKVNERFTRETLLISKDRQQEWVNNTVKYVYDYMDATDNNEWPMRVGSWCDAYSGCSYRKLCEASPIVRGDMMKREYKVNDKWSPAAHLLKKEETKDENI